MLTFTKKRNWLILIFSVLLISASLFVWWMSSSNFKSSYKEIKHQYYSVVAEQVVSELEASIKYGKSLDSFYNIDGIFAKLTSLLPAHIKAVITNSKGDVLYTSFDNNEDKNEVIKVIQNQNVVMKLQNITLAQSYVSLEQGNHEVMILPIGDKSGVVIGSLVLICPSAAITVELEPQQMETLRISLLVLGISLLLLIIFLCFAPVPEETENDRRRQLLLKVVPALIVMVCIGVQSITMYDQYKAKYKSAIADGAGGILTYIETTVGSMYQKGIPYEQMDGLTEYLTGKAKDTPIIWNIRIYNSIADTGEVLEREDSWRISAPLTHKKEGADTQVEIQLSQEYMDEQMLNMLLVFLVTMIAATVIIFEAMRLPDLLMFRRSRQYNTGSVIQYEKITSGLRIETFIFFMAVYASMPFSAILIRNWDAQLFGLSTDMTASLPMTFELLSLMLFSLVFARFFSKSASRVLLCVSAIVIILGNILSALVTGPLYLILCRVLCGAGFAGIKNVLNAIIASGSEGSERTGLHIAAMNAGILGGIMCGGSLGAVIANSISTSFTYLFTAGILLVAIAILLYIFPWKLIKQKMETVTTGVKNMSQGMGHVLLQGKVLKYLVMVTLPLNLGLMFIVAFIPGYVQKVNLPVILVSYGYLVNGLLGIYLGPVLAKVLTRRLGRTVSVALMLLIGGIAISILSIKPSVAIILLSTALMGLFDGFGSPVSTDYFLEMPEIKDNIDIPSSLAFLGVMGNAIQMVSPMIYGWLLLIAAVTGINSLLVLGLVYLAFAVLFLAPFRGNYANPKRLSSKNMSA
ncbi:MAG: MFS transporter [Heliobacteriaceae bacterium]|nr:MFS transporter [Heliobacteriaceae bacterium]